jgi:alkaline phosphatase
MAPDSTPLETVLEAAARRGLATGLVTTTHLTDATPAAFGAHVPWRYDYATIAAQLAQQDIEVLLGGGYKYFAQRTDGRDLVRELDAKYEVVRTPEQFAALDTARTQYLLGLFADSTMYGDKGVRPSLPDMARTALAILSRDPEGFFLLLESEDTDDVFHDTLSASAALPSLRELDATVAVALEFQARHPETLVVVTGDHETGGLAVTLPRETGRLETMYNSTDHTAGMVPIFAGGPGAEHFGRWLTNEAVGKLLFAAVGSMHRSP